MNSRIARKLTLAVLFSLCFSIGVSQSKADQDAHIDSQSLDALAASVGIDGSAKKSETRRPLKIAILDNGFRGFQEARGTSLPVSTQLHNGPIPIDVKSEDGHGTKIAEIFSNLLDRTNVSYELHLFHSFGYSNLNSAVSKVIKDRFDLVLYSQVWEYGGNGDGRGFINALVSKATASGVAWVNATGNFAKKTYRAPVEKSLDDWAYLPGNNGSVQLRCHRNASNLCHVRLVLTWNSFSDDVTVGTDKDLDLVLTDDTGKIIRNAGLQQKKSIVPGEQGVSLYPREIIEADVKPGLYYAKVKLRSSNFSKADELRISLSGDFTELLNRTEGETLLPPADNASVISVGAFDTNESSFSRKLQKPDLSSPSFIATNDGAQFKGSSNSAAAYAARVAFELSRVKHYSRENILVTLQGGTPRTTKIPSGTLENIEITPTGHASRGGKACFVFHSLQLTVPHVRRILREGGVVVETNSGPKIFLNEDPFVVVARIGLKVLLQNSTSNPNGILVADAQGLYVTSIDQRMYLPAHSVEIAQTPQSASYCPLR